MEQTKRRRIGVVGSLAGACGVLGMAFAAQVGLAQQVAAKPAVTSSTPAPAAVRAAKPAAAEEEETAKPSKPGEQGIKVHGHWVMDVKNADGTLVKHLDFQNSLTIGMPPVGGIQERGFTGDQVLGALLSGYGVIGDPAIAFFQAPSPGTSVPATTDISDCIEPPGGYSCALLTTTASSLFAPISAYTAQNPQYFGSYLGVQLGLSRNMTLGPVSWVLSGNFLVPAGMTSITVVQTAMSMCYVTGLNTAPYSLYGFTAIPLAPIAPTACTYPFTAGQTTPAIAGVGNLTSAIVPGAPLGVTPGQIIFVTVTITFS